MAIYKSKFTGKQVDALLDKVSTKQDKLTAGKGITITGTTISVNLDFTLYKVVSELPTENIEANKIYLKAGAVIGKENKYTEYIYVNGAWEILGEFTTSVDLTNYVTNDIFNTLSSTVDNMGDNLNILNNSMDSANRRITALEGKVTPITDDANYEVVLFKKNT
nr:MAG TPA: WAHD domain protein [Crassvirales sp.]